MPIPLSVKLMMIFESCTSRLILTVGSSLSLYLIPFSMIFWNSSLICRASPNIVGSLSAFICNDFLWIKCEKFDFTSFTILFKSIHSLVEDSDSSVE